MLILGNGRSANPAQTALPIGGRKSLPVGILRD
jgi:hypothetical protein